MFGGLKVLGGWRLAFWAFLCSIIGIATVIVLVSQEGDATATSLEASEVEPAEDIADEDQSLDFSATTIVNNLSSDTPEVDLVDPSSPEQEPTMEGRRIEVTAAEEIPSFVDLSFCGGNVVEHRRILITSAHCLTEETDGDSLIIDSDLVSYFDIGGYDDETRENRIPWLAARLISVGHDDTEGDIAVFLLSEDAGVEPMDVVGYGESVQGPHTFYGKGRLCPSGEECANTDGQLYKRNVSSVGFDPESPSFVTWPGDACFGDSGGAGVQGNIQTSIISFTSDGSTCLDTVYATDLSKFPIEEEIRQLVEDFDDSFEVASEAVASGDTDSSAVAATPRCNLPAGSKETYINVHYVVQQNGFDPSHGAVAQKCDLPYNIGIHTDRIEMGTNIEISLNIAGETLNKMVFDNNSFKKETTYSTKTRSNPPFPKFVDTERENTYTPVCGAAGTFC